MAYPAPFHRLVMIGGLYVDTFNTTLSIVPSGAGAMPAVTQTLLDAVTNAVKAWWVDTASASPGGGPDLMSKAILTSIKLNRIGTDGKYMDPEAMENTFTGVNGSGGLDNVLPQASIATTLRGANERARAGKGRFYLPPSVQVTQIGTDGRLPTINATIVANGSANLLGILNDVYLTAGIPAVVGIASKAGAGAFQTVEKVTVGRVVDTIRSRRSKLPEDFVTATF